MDSSVDGKIIRQKFFRVQNRVERFYGDCLLMLAKENPARGHTFRIELCYEIYKIYDFSR